MVQYNQQDNLTKIEEEEKHAKFERMRSRHYDMKAALANKSFNDDDE